MDRREYIKTILLGSASIPFLKGYNSKQSGGKSALPERLVLDPKNIANITYNKPFESRFVSTPNRIWPGEDYWVNPMEDWRVHSGRLECMSEGANRNVHILTRALGTTRGSFDITVRTGLIKQGSQGSTGFRIGVREPGIDDYRSNVFYGKGLDAGCTVDGRLVLADQEKQLNTGSSLEDIKLQLKGEPDMHEYTLTLTAYDASDNKLGELTVDDISTDQVVGNIALVNNHSNAGSRFWYRDWSISGTKISAFPDRAFGPILWSMYSLNNTGGKEGHVLKMSAQMPPMGMKDSDEVALQIKENGSWKTVAQESIDTDSRNALFRLNNWKANESIPYRLVYETQDTAGEIRRDEWSGVIRKDPVNEGEISIASLSCQHDSGFPYKPVVDNIGVVDPDMLTFHGDQYYEGNGGYGVVRDTDKGGTDKAIINYLRKYYMFGWVFGDLMRSRPAILLADDHDVFQGNLWGEGGSDPDGTNPSTSGGYIMSPRWVNAVHHTQLAHNPDVYDPAPIKNDISAWYGDMTYGGVSFAIISERMFKSSPKSVDTGKEGRADLVETADFDPAEFNKPGLKLLGDRQTKFLEEWVEDWKHAKMKVVLGQSPFANLNTHSGPQGERLYADLDSNGWPQDARNEAVRILRKGFVLHIAGDQHLPTGVQYGVDEPGDANWGYSPPAISVGWPRWWLADEVGFEFTNRPEHNLPNTGEYTDPFGNPVSIYAVGNPTALEGANRYDRAHAKSSGFGVIRLNTSDRSIRMEAYRFKADIKNPAVENQFPGWPLSIDQFDNYGRNPVGYLPEISYTKSEHPVVKVFNEESNELVYAIRSESSAFEPFVFEEGSYRVEIGDPENDEWSVIEGQQLI
jgi:phosphodiesterase/alkaline phosphatase D-like protein